jgi:hypothetical protein
MLETADFRLRKRADFLGRFAVVEMTQKLGVKALARLGGVRPNAVRKARASDRLVAGADGRFDLARPGNQRRVVWRQQGLEGMGRDSSGTAARHCALGGGAPTLRAGYSKTQPGSGQT